MNIKAVFGRGPAALASDLSKIESLVRDHAENVHKAFDSRVELMSELREELALLGQLRANTDQILSQFKEGTT